VQPSYLKMSETLSSYRLPPASHPWRATVTLLTGASNDNLPRGADSWKAEPPVSWIVQFLELAWLTGPVSQPETTRHPSPE